MVRILAFFLGVVALGCILAPPAWWVGRWLIEAELVPKIAGFAFPSYLRRTLLLALVLLAWPFFRSLGIRDWAHLGFRANARRWQDLAVGACLGSAGLLLVASVKVGMGAAELRHDVPWSRLDGMLLSALVVPLIEEPIFRGVIQGTLWRRLAWAPALAFASVFFAAVHFVSKPLDELLAGEVHWGSGFEVFPRMLWQFGDPDLIQARFTTLLLVGLVLGYAAMRSRSLALSLGLHGGWIFALKLFQQGTRNHEPSVWFGERLTEGVAPALLLVATWSFAVWYLRKREPVGGCDPSR